MEYKLAAEIAVSKCVHLQPHTTKINIAGSLRRKKDDVKDIEIVCVPAVSTGVDLFGHSSGEIRSPQFIEAVNSLGKIIKGQATGRMMQIELPEGIMLDLFITTREDYFRQYAIRTGSAHYAARYIAGGWKRKGWCGSDQGLRKISDCVEMKGPDGKSKWKCLNKQAELPPYWKTEEEFFKWINHPYEKPIFRN